MYVSKYLPTTLAYLFIVETTDIAALALNRDIKNPSMGYAMACSIQSSKTEERLILRKTARQVHPLYRRTILIFSHKHLGLNLSDDGSWHDHIEYMYIVKKTYTRINVLRRV